ncbi:uncharacterized protein LOC129729420 [Wyeomyia smithii]|uniref:uncharacterized protein LOC129729420 n=1 Tax=Wyeomyia smithii TaxID=174621 RepID=UPI002467DCC4|nr:uncharacterized protein LOC129729420 [Wyeomyia smithii]
MFRVTRFVSSCFGRLHGYLTQNYRKVLLLCLLLAITTLTIHWLSYQTPESFKKLRKGLAEFPFGMALGVLTITVISAVLLYALHLESVESSHARTRTAIRWKYIDYILLCLSTQLAEATERYLQQGVLTPVQLDVMRVEIEACIDRFRHGARKLLDSRATASTATIQELEHIFQLDQQAVRLGEDILKLKRKSKPLLSDRAIKALLRK